MWYEDREREQRDAEREHCYTVRSTNMQGTRRKQGEGTCTHAYILGRIE